MKLKIDNSTRNGPKPIVCLATFLIISTQLDRIVGQTQIKNNIKVTNSSAGVADQLPEITSSTNANSAQFFETSETVLSGNEQKLSQHSLSQWVQMCLMTLVQSAAYRDVYFHRYDNFEDMKRASGPEVDNEQCIRQLENMVARVERQERVGYASKDLNIYKIRDTWARKPERLLRGNLFAEGDYEECLRLKLELAERRAEMRYCVVNVQGKDWPQLDKHDILQVKAGICIPKACDSLDYKNKYELISKIGSYQLKPVDREGLMMKSLYCLPDEKSEFRSIWHSPKSLATLICVLSWCSLLVFATYKCNKLERLNDPNRARELKIYRMLSITNNLRQLFDTSKESSLIKKETDKVEIVETSKLNQGNGEISQTSDQDQQDPEQEKETKLQTIDLRCIEGIKVIAMCYIIMGHVLMCLPTVMENGADLARLGLDSLSFLTANLVPAFAVNSFFAITGLLTSYLLFKENKTKRVITSPVKWAAVVLYRYLRIMPMYALVVLYCKTLAKYTGSGPLWDYGTSALSQRRICEQESWRFTLTFSSNFLPPIEHCIPGGWYLSNDFQFFLITPFYMALLHCRPRLGKTLLLMSIAAGYLAGFFSIYNSDLVDLRPIANFAPSGFKTFVSHLSFTYTYPLFRVPAYLVGLLIGFQLHRLEQEKEHFNQLAANERSGRKPPCWPEALKQYGAYLVASLFVLYTITSFIGTLLPFQKTTARFMVSFVNPSYHVLFALSVGLFIMLASTGHANKRIVRFLSAPQWKPLARLSLCAVLVNVEVISYILQSSPKQLHITNRLHMLLNFVCILATYLVATIVCVLFEAPIRSGLNAIMTRQSDRLAAKQKNKSN